MTDKPERSEQPCPIHVPTFNERCLCCKGFADLSRQLAAATKALETEAAERTISEIRKLAKENECDDYDCQSCHELPAFGHSPDCWLAAILTMCEKILRERAAAEMASDKDVLKSVAESRAAYEVGKTLTLDQAFKSEDSQQVGEKKEE